MFEDLNSVFASRSQKVINALKLISQMESGEIVNKTAVAKESENRTVDHYNLRMEQEIVKGKTLASTLQKWYEIELFAQKIMNGDILTPLGKKYQTIIFNGIGGSYLGPLMLIVSQYGDEYNSTVSLPLNIYFISNTDSEYFSQITTAIEPSTSIMFHLSKSGSTSETAGNMEAWNMILEAEKLPIGPHSGAVTIEGSQLDQFARANNFISNIYMSVDTGGRTSVISAIGMVPLAFAKLDFASFAKGMSYMDMLTRRTENNPAALIASAIDALTEKVGFKNMIVLGYNEYLKQYAHYLQQLYMESLGKEYCVDASPAHVGQTVFGGVGTSEQHSFMQQVQKGLSDCFVRLLYFERREVDYINKQAGSMGRQFLSFLKGTEKALLKNKRPFITQILPERNLFNLGMMIALEERVVTFLGSFMEINAYDQPGVQDGKLAATDVNTTSKQITQLLRESIKKGPISGTTQDILKAIGFQGDIPFEAEAILHDIVVNHSVLQSYIGFTKINATREWINDQKQFKFTFAE